MWNIFCSTTAKQTVISQKKVGFGCHLLTHANIFIFLTVMPLLYCYLRAHNNHENHYDNSKFLSIIVDYILSSALVVYTLILGIYILKIVVVQELPRGGVAYMVSVYIALALCANLLNKLVEKSHFNWFLQQFYDIDKIRQDSTLKAKFLKMQDEYYFLRVNCDSLPANSLTINNYDLADEVRSTYFELSEYTDKVSLDGFDNFLLKPYRGETTEDGVFVIKNGNTKILEYHFRDTINAVGDDFYKNPLRVLKYHNDSIMVIFKDCRLYKTDSVYDIDSFDYEIFCK